MRHDVVMQCAITLDAGAMEKPFQGGVDALFAASVPNPSATLH
jgi:hypothetical protein